MIRYNSPEVAGVLEQMIKSFDNIASLGMAEDGKVGLAAVHVSAQAKHYRMTMTDKDLFWMKRMPTEKEGSTVHSYSVQNQNGSLYTDHAIMENGIGKESAPNMQKMAVPLKVYGAATSKSHMVKLADDNGNFSVNLDAIQKDSALMSMNKSMENDASYGLDMFINASGEIESSLGFNVNLINPNRRMNFRHATGIHSYVRNHNDSIRSTPVEFLGYGNIQSVVQNWKGKVLDQEDLDDLLGPVYESGGEVEEALCTYTQSAAFRQTFFPMQRADIGAAFKINGPDIKADLNKEIGFTVVTNAGPVTFTPYRFRAFANKKIVRDAYNRGNLPMKPTVAATLVSNETRFKVGQKVAIAVLAVDIFGQSDLDYQVITITEDGQAINLAIAPHAVAESFSVYASEPKSNPTQADLFFVGRAVAANGSVTNFLHKETLMPGLDSLLFVPPKKGVFEGMGVFYRAVLGGQSMYEFDLPFMGALFQRSYISYYQNVCNYGRTYSLIDNVGAKINKSKSILDFTSAP